MDFDFVYLHFASIRLLNKLLKTEIEFVHECGWKQIKTKENKSEIVFSLLKLFIDQHAVCCFVASMICCFASYAMMMQMMA